MNLTLYNISNIYNKNIIILGRKLSGKTNLIKKILDNLDYDKKYCLNMSIHEKIDEELNIPTYSDKNFEYVYNNITETCGNKILIIENFNYLYSNLLNNKNLLELLKNNDKYNVTIIFVLNNNQLNFKNINEKFYNYIHIMFLSSVYFDINHYIDQLFKLKLSEDQFELIINNYIEKKRYIVFECKQLNYL